MAIAAGTKNIMCTTENISQKTVKTVVPDMAISKLLATFGTPNKGRSLAIDRNVSTSSEHMVEIAAPTIPRMGISIKFPITFTDAANH